jgi:uncharacterized protein YeaO (DUF488 family)
MEVELWFKKFAPSSELQQLFRHDPCNFQKPYRAERKGKASMCQDPLTLLLQARHNSRSALSR